MIEFSPDVSVDLLEIAPVQTELIELSAGFGTSTYQALQDYITLDGGSAGDVFTNIAPLDGGTA